MPGNENAGADAGPYGTEDAVHLNAAGEIAFMNLFVAELMAELVAVLAAAGAEVK
jgi:hypothetical protein